MVEYHNFGYPMICTQLCIILIFKPPRKHIYRGLKINNNHYYYYRRRIIVVTEDTKETTYLFQRSSVALQKGNAASFRNILLSE